MIEFITENFHFITYGFEIMALIIGLIFFRKYKNTTVRIFIIFLLYTVVVELIGVSLIYFRDFYIFKLAREMGLNVNIWYNVFWLFGSVLFLAFYYHSLLKQKSNKLIVKVSVVLFIILMLSHAMLNPQVFINTHPSFYLLLGLTVTCICIALYFIELLKSEAILNVKHTFGIYVSIGLLVWWLIITPVLFFDHYNSEADWDFANLKRRIFLFANIFMYTSFSIGLITSKPESIND